MAAFRQVHNMHACVTVGLVGGGGSPPLGHDHACCHLQDDCLESGISSGPPRLTVSMVTFYVLTADIRGDGEARR